MNQYTRPVAGGINRLRSLMLLLSLLVVSCAGGVRTPQIRVPDFDSQDYRLIWPLPISTTARITSPFGRRKDPFTGMQRFHGGVDLDGVTGDPVYSAGAGEVIFSGERSGYGLMIIIDHGKGLNSYYGHCSKLLKSRGKKVNRGEIIALLGSTGRSSGSHLHFETRKHGQPFDPVLILPRLKKL